MTSMVQVEPRAVEEEDVTGPKVDAQTGLLITRAEAVPKSFAVAGGVQATDDVRLVFTLIFSVCCELLQVFC